jgi:hypothetical protein
MPARIAAGESIAWRWSNTNFPASAWTLTYSLLNESAKIQFTAGVSHEHHLIQVASNVSANWAPGEYSWQAHISREGERYKVDEGSVTILADFANADGVDPRSHVKKVLDALEASIENRASKTQMQQSVGGAQIQHMSLTEQITLRDRYRLKYQKELAAKRGRSSRRTIGSRFAN